MACPANVFVEAIKTKRLGVKIGWNTGQRGSFLRGPSLVSWYFFVSEYFLASPISLYRRNFARELPFRAVYIFTLYLHRRRNFEKKTEGRETF